MTETLFNSLKVERLRDMPFAPRRQAKDEAIDWLWFYSCQSLHSTLGYLSPVEFKKKRLVKKSFVA
jgi:putative transposase